MSVRQETKYRRCPPCPPRLLRFSCSSEPATLSAMTPREFWEKLTVTPAATRKLSPMMRPKSHGRTEIQLWKITRLHRFGPFDAEQSPVPVALRETHEHAWMGFYPRHLCAPGLQAQDVCCPLPSEAQPSTTQTTDVRSPDSRHRAVQRNRPHSAKHTTGGCSSAGQRER